jgi:hypothetical protein
LALEHPFPVRQAVGARESAGYVLQVEVRVSVQVVHM